MLPRSLGALLIALALATSGCGGGNESAESDEQAATAAYRSFVNAFATGDGQTACGLMSKRAVRRAVRSGQRLSGTPGCEAAITDAVRGLPDAQRKSHELSWRRTRITDVAVTGDVARLTLRLPITRPAADEVDRDDDSVRAGQARLIKENGRWRVDVLR